MSFSLIKILCGFAVDDEMKMREALWRLPHGLCVFDKFSFLTDHLWLVEGVVLGEDGHAFVEDVILVILDE